MSVLTAAILGAFLLLARKGVGPHRVLGRIWLCLMAIAALSSFLIHTIDLFHGFSPIHLLSLYVLYGTVAAYRAARQGRIAAHRRQVIGLYFGGIVGAGVFTLLPGRIMHSVFWGNGGNDRVTIILLALLGLSVLVGRLLYRLFGRKTAEAERRTLRVPIIRPSSKLPSTSWIAQAPKRGRL